MLVYFADLAHDHFKVNQYTPTGIGYLTAYSKFKLGNRVKFRLFKSVNKLLDTYEKEKPDLIGLSNYTWNTGLSKFAGSFIKKRDPSLPIINKSNSDFQMKINLKDKQEKDWDKSIENWLIS